MEILYYYSLILSGLKSNYFITVLYIKKCNLFLLKTVSYTVQIYTQLIFGGPWH